MMSISPNSGPSPIDGDSNLLPKSIFEEKSPVKQEDFKKLEESVNSVVSKAFDLLSKGTSSKEQFYAFVLDASKGNQQVAHLALKILAANVQNREQKAMITSLSAEFCNILFNSTQGVITSTLDYVSPKEISLKEGDLPAIPENHRTLIKGYLRGDVTIDDVVNQLGLTKDSTKEILKSIKIMDLEFDRLSSQDKSALNYTNSTYELRTLCLQASEGEMNTYEAYTKSIKPEYFANQFSPIAREYASHEYNYIPERCRDHARVSQNYAVEMMQLSRRLDLPSRVFYCIGGNCGVGKSRCAKMDAEFSKGVVDGEIVGALSLDTLKGKLRKGVDKVTNQQVHAEGWVLAQKLALELETKAVKASVVVDERLGTASAIKQIADVAEKTDAKLRYKDIDGSLLVSALRVIGRDIKTEPCMPYNPISSGQKTLRQQRKDVIEIASTNPVFESYQLFVADEIGNQVLAAEKKEGSFVVYNQTLFDKSMEIPSDKELEEIYTQVISDTFIAEVSQLKGINTTTLEQYKGLTIGEALEQHSKELPIFG